jgi:hypothetical protein
MDWVTKRLGFSTTIKPRQIPSVMPAVYGVEDGDDAPNEPDGGAEAAGFHLRIPSNVIFKLAQLKKEAARLHPPVRGSR